MIWRLAFEEGKTVIHKEPQVGGCLVCTRNSQEARIFGMATKRREW